MEDRDRPAGSEPLSTTHDKPTNVKGMSCSAGIPRGLLQQPSLIWIATVVLFIACLYPIYKHSTAMEQTIQELKLLQKNSEKEISKLETSIVNMKDMETEMEDLKRELTLVTEDSRNNNKILGSTEHDLNKIRMFVKEIYMNLTVTNTLTDTHNSSIQHMYNFTGTINETLVNVQKQLNENIISVTKHLEQMESCQSGGNVELGSLNYPTREFPFELTIPFNPPFRKVPSLLYSNTLLDPVATSYGNSLDIHVKLVSLTPESFTIKLIKPGKTHAIYGARINWIACPKL